MKNKDLKKRILQIAYKNKYFNAKSLAYRSSDAYNIASSLEKYILKLN